MMNASSFNGFESLESCFQSLLIVSAIGSIVVLMAIAIHVIASKWISATWLYVFWFVVLIRFVVFATPESPTSLLNLVMQPTQSSISLIDSDTQGLGGNERLIFTSDSVVPIPIDEQAASIRWWPLSIWTLAAIGWLVVVSGLMCRLGLGYLSVKRLVRKTTEPPSELLSRFENLKRQTGLRRRTRLRISNELEIPAMVGTLNPIVIVPEWCCRELDEEQLEMIFTHELIHIQRCDGLIQLVAHLIVVLHWFNPLARIAARFIESTRELSCDRRVIEIWKKSKSVRTQAGSAAETLLIERKYGKTILDIAGRASSVNNASQFNAAFLGGFVGSNQNLIKQRIAMLVNSRSQWWLRNVVAGGFIALLLAVGFTSAQTVCPPCPPTEVQHDNLLPLLPQAVPTEQPVSSLLPLLPEVPIYRVATSGEPVLYDVPLAAPDLKPLPHSQPILLNVGEVKRLKFDYSIPELMVKVPAILNVTPLAPKEMRFTAVAPGKTEVHVSNFDRKVQILRFRIVPDVRELKSKVEKEFSDAKVYITATTDGFVNLVGHVTTEQVSKINKFVIANCDLPVRNQLSDKAPIAIKIKVYEVSTTKLNQLGGDWSKYRADLPKDIKGLQTLLPAKDAGVVKLEDDSLQNFLTVCERHQIATLLDQPILVAHHGHAAEYLSGGEVPVAVIDEKGQHSVEFRSFGTKIQATPHVHSKDEMTLEIHTEVSRVDKEQSSITSVPQFRVRRVNTGMRVKPGETIALIGDYREETNGDKDTTELVFLLTPRLIEQGSELKLSKEAAAAKKEASKKR